MAEYEDDFEEFNEDGDESESSLLNSVLAPRLSTKQAKYGTAPKLLSSWNPIIRRARGLRSQLALDSEHQVIFDQISLTAHQMYWLKLRDAKSGQRE